MKIPFSLAFLALAAAAADTASAAALVFHAPLDGSPVAAVAAGDPAPIVAEGLDWADGPLPGTKALRMGAPGASCLAYSAAGNLPRDSGTVAVWTRREWDFSLAEQPWRAIFATPMPNGRAKGRIGTGALWFWWQDSRLRADQSDAKDRYARCDGLPLDDSWMHLAFTWRPGRVELFVNGERRRYLRDMDSPIRDAIAEAAAAAAVPDRSGIDRFFLGSVDGEEPADSLFSDLRIYDAPLAEEEIRGICRESAISRRAAEAQSASAGELLRASAALRDFSATPHTRPPLPGEAPGTIAPEALELVAEIRPAELAAEAAGAAATSDFSSVGNFRIVPGNAGSVAGAPSPAVPAGAPSPAYLEAGPKKGDRFAVRLRLPAGHPLFLLEIDVPDDALRTEDLIVQPCKGGGDYALQVGLLLGGEYPNSGKMLTHRCIYWARTNNVALVAMTAREGAPAAVSAIRAYAVASLPAHGAVASLSAHGAVASLPAHGQWPCASTPAAAGALLGAAGAEQGVEAAGHGPAAGGRSAALYYEDPALNLQFGLPAAVTATAGGFAEELSRLSAVMRFTGFDTLFYPGAWYQSLIEHGGYNPRGHAPHWRDILYDAFDAEGLSFVPTINLNNIPWKPGDVTVESLSDGSLHSSPIAIHDTGKPNPGLWHNTPPNYNFFHPAVQAEIVRVFDTLVAEGASHPSFRGVCLHLTQHCCLWWGSDKSGYNDYAIAAFCRDRGLEPPAPIAAAPGSQLDGTALQAVQRGSGGAAPPAPPAPPAPLRGRDYAAWLRSDPSLWDAWLQWRCDQVTAFYARLAAKLAAAHPGASLYINHFVPPDLKRADFDSPDFTRLSARRAGLDVPALEAAIPNLVVMQSDVPADHRWGYVDHYFRFDDPSRRETAISTLRDLDSTPGFWALLGETSRPWANLHDRYWESAIGARGDTLSCDWLDEHSWRVSTLNPGGASALAHFTRPLRFHDALGLSKGGFLVGTYGMEEKLAPFALAFRSLPPVLLPELPESTAIVKVRGGEYAGTNYIYAVNTGDTAVEVALPIPPGAVELGLGNLIFNAETQSRKEENSAVSAALREKKTAALREKKTAALRAVKLAPNSLRAFAWAVSADGIAESLALPPYASISGSTLAVEIPAGAAGRTAHCVAALDLSPYFAAGMGVRASVRVSGENISEPDHVWNGAKFMFHYVEEATGEVRWPGAAIPTGSFTNHLAEIRLSPFGLGGLPKGGRAELILGLEGCTGRAEFDLSTLRIEAEDWGLAPTNQDWIVRYPDGNRPQMSNVHKSSLSINANTNLNGVARQSGEPRDLHLRFVDNEDLRFVNNQPLRGCMLPGRATREDDIETLHNWGATLVRFQITRNWWKVDDNQDLDEYARWVDSRLDNLADVLEWCSARGMKVCIDLHALPGGKSGFRGRPWEMNMFRDERCLAAFLDTWRRIAARFRGHPAIYGYDLVNEPHQRGPAPFSYWEVQRLAAEAVREIDPDTPVVVESNLADRACAFRYLSPLAMDNVIYQCHMYQPTEYTHQGVAGNPATDGGKPLAWPGTFHGQVWDKEFVRRELEPVLAFQRRHKCKIYVGEFSAAAFAPGAENYLRDCIELFEEYGWDWTYHAFREAPVWDVEMEGPDGSHLSPSPSPTPRKRVLLDALSAK